MSGNEIRIISGVLFLCALGLLLWRRSRNKEA